MSLIWVTLSDDVIGTRVLFTCKDDNIWDYFNVVSFHIQERSSLCVLLEHDRELYRCSTMLYWMSSIVLLYRCSTRRPLVFLDFINKPCTGDQSN